MSNIVAVFEFRSQQVRTAGTAENPLFCLTDIAEVLSISNSRDLNSRLIQDGVATIDITDKRGIIRGITFINESNLYRVIFQSRKIQAKEFQDWVFSEVLPTIRKTGKYQIQNNTEHQPIVHKFPNQIIGEISPDPTALLINKANTVFDLLFPSVEPEIRLGMKIEAVCTVDPSLRLMLEPFKPKLLSHAPLLTPTEIGLKLEAKDGIKRSGQAVNKILIGQGFQVKTNDKKLPYRAVGQGIEFSKIVADTAAGHAKTITSLRWYESIINLIV